MTVISRGNASERSTKTRQHPDTLSTGLGIHFVRAICNNLQAGAFGAVKIKQE